MTSRRYVIPLTTYDEIRDLLQSVRTVALVGASDRPDRPSYGVMTALQNHGYRVLPVNPQITGEHVHGEYVWRALSQIGVPLDMVDIFRRPDAVGLLVVAAIEIRAKEIWTPLGVVNEDAAARDGVPGLALG